MEGLVHTPKLDRAFADKTATLHSELLAKALERGAHRTQALVRQGVPPYRMLLEFIREEEAGLVVMGCKGVGRFSKLLLGSVAERVVCGGAAPVLLVRKEMP
jgi:nucleotide-binding universal stress UspA family protein